MTGYGLISRTLHWLTAAALAAQFTIGYLLEADGRGRGRGRGRGGDSGHGRGRGGDVDVFGDRLLTAHVVLGLSILTLTVLRLWWRRRAGLPPWAATLSPAERTFAHWTERALYLLLFVVPLTGLWLVVVSDDAVAVHVVGHIALFVALAAHLGLVLKHQLIHRDRFAATDDLNMRACDTPVDNAAAAERRAASPANADIGPAIVSSMRARRFRRIIQIDSEVADGRHRVGPRPRRSRTHRSVWCAAGRESGPFGITVNAVAPGVIPGERHDAVPAATRAVYLPTVRAGRMGTPQDIAHVVSLASPGAGFVTGQRIIVDGGRCLMI